MGKRKPENKQTNKQANEQINKYIYVEVHYTWSKMNVMPMIPPPPNSVVPLVTSPYTRKKNQ